MTIALTPLFKGDHPAPTGLHAHAERRLYETVITGMDPDTMQPVSQDEYMRLLGIAKATNRQLVENVSRVAAADAIAEMVSRNGDVETQPIYAEGCNWDWGMQKRTGAETQLSIHERVIPSSLRMGKRYPIIEHYSSRTLDEMRRVFELSTRLRDLTSVEFVTHSYHRERSHSLANEVRTSVDPSHAPSFVHTPGNIADQYEQTIRRKLQRTGDECFMADLMRAGEPDADVRAMEAKKEQKLRGLMHVRQWTGLDPEAWILGAMKKWKSR